MKLMFAALLLLFIGCKSKDKTENTSMPGAYKMLSQTRKSTTVDTTIKGGQQLKIYTDDFIMYAGINSPDSVSWFGVGSYSMNKDTVSEHIVYSAGDSTSDDTARHYTLMIEKTTKGYKQVIPEIGTGNNKVKLTEDYETVGTSSKSDLDGSWKLVKRFTVKGTDTTKQETVQYKTYFAGYCIWGNTWKDSVNKQHTGIGFGTFTMTGNKVKESMTASTYSDVRGHSFDIDIALNGKDEFTQTMTNPDGTKGVEVYTRMKK
jgi:hypothetical protein